MNRLFRILLDVIRERGGLSGILDALVEDPTLIQLILSAIGAIAQRTEVGAPERMEDPETLLLQDDLANALHDQGEPVKLFSGRGEVLRFIGTRLLRLLIEHMENRE